MKQRKHQEKEMKTEDGESASALDCQLLAIYLEEAANAMEGSEIFIDMENWLIVDEFHNNNKNLRRHLQVGSGGKCLSPFSIADMWFANRDVA